MATVSKWDVHGVYVDITATTSSVTRKSASSYEVQFTVSWKVSYSGNNMLFGMKASSGGKTATITAFNGSSHSSGSGSLTGTYSISGNSAQSKSVTVTFEAYSDIESQSVTKPISLTVNVPAWTSYTVQYNANGGTGAPGNQTKWKDQALTLSSSKPTREGYSFQGWALSKSLADEGTWYYQPGGSCGKNENLTLYAVWKVYTLTINYYSNYATKAYDDAINEVGADKNVIIRTGTWNYDTVITNGLHNYSQVGDGTYLGRLGYAGTGYWGTTTSGGTLIHEDTAFATAQALAEALGKSLKTGNATVSLYAQWERLGNLHYNDNGTYKRGMAWVKDNGTWKIGLAWINVNGTWKQGI